MTRLNDDQRDFLREVRRQRAKWQRLLKAAATVRGGLDEMLVQGSELGISTHRLADATGLSQPRVHQILKEHHTS